MSCPLKCAAAALALVVAAACLRSVPLPKYDEYVWPPPPDQPRIRLLDIVYGRSDVRAETSGVQRALLGASPQGPFDWFKKPFAVEFDRKGRLLVTDSGLGALFRLDRATRHADILGARGAVPLKTPMGIGMGKDGVAYVADAGLKKVVALDEEGKIRAVYGTQGELKNPTDAAVSPDGTRLFVADSHAHSIVVFELKTAKQLASFGKQGKGPGEFSYPTSLAFDASGNLLVVDQINARVQILGQDGNYLDQFGGQGVGFANFVRPKDVAVDEEGLIYVSDAAFGNVQIFDADLRLLTFVGSNGSGPGQFQLASGIAVRGERFAVVDQLGLRVQVFRYLTPKHAE